MIVAPKAAELKASNADDQNRDEAQSRQDLPAGAFTELGNSISGGRSSSGGSAGMSLACFAIFGNAGQNLTDLSPRKLHRAGICGRGCHNATAECCPIPLRTFNMTSQVRTPQEAPDASSAALRPKLRAMGSHVNVGQSTRQFWTPCAVQAVVCKKSWLIWFSYYLEEEGALTAAVANSCH